MNLLLFCWAVLALLIVGAWGMVCYYRRQARKAQTELNEAIAEMQRITRDYATVKQQRDNQRERLKHESNTHRANRDELIDGLSNAGDLRD